MMENSLGHGNVTTAEAQPAVPGIQVSLAPVASWGAGSLEGSHPFPHGRALVLPDWQIT